MKKRAFDTSLPAFDLLSNLLIYDPDKRMNSGDALKHPYFYNKPLPTADVFSCFETRIPFPNRKFLAPTTTQPKNLNPVVVVTNQPNPNLKQVSVRPKVEPTTTKYQPVTRVTRRSYLQERNF